MAHILERGITLIHPYYRNKSDQKDKFFEKLFLVVFEICKVNDDEITYTSVNFIHHLDLVKIIYKINENQVCVVRLIPGLKLFLLREYGPM